MSDSSPRVARCSACGVMAPCWFDPPRCVRCAAVLGRKREGVSRALRQRALLRRFGPVVTR